MYDINVYQYESKPYNFSGKYGILPLNEKGLKKYILTLKFEFFYIIILDLRKTNSKNCSSESVWGLIRTSNPEGAKAPGVRFALWSDFFKIKYFYKDKLTLFKYKTPGSIHHSPH